MHLLLVGKGWINMRCPNYRITLTPFKCPRCGYIYTPKVVKRLDVELRNKGMLKRNKDGRFEAKQHPQAWD